MNNNNGNRFFDGFLLGAILGGTAVFLFGTRSGRNLLKIVSEQGLDGLTNLLEEYDLVDIQEEIQENFDGEPSSAKASEGQEKESSGTVPEVKPKKRFFHRAKK